MVSTVLLGWFKILLPCRMYARDAETVMFRAKTPRNTSRRHLTEDIVWERDRPLIQQSMLQVHGMSVVWGNMRFIGRAVASCFTA